VIILGGSNGGLYEWLAQLFASHGFAALTLAYFKYRDLPGELLEIPLEYFHRAIGWMKSQKAIRPDRLGIVGGSKGAELALILATVYDDFRAVVAWSPAAHVWQGLSDTMKPASSWSLAGRGLPYVPWVFTPEDMVKYQKGELISVRQCYELGLQQSSPQVIAEAAIAVEKISAPILMVSGTDDQTWPASDFCRTIANRLKKNNFSYEYKHVSIKGGGHQIFIPNYVITGHNRYWNGGCSRDDAHGSFLSWKETLAFLNRHLSR
jgi:dienelactone hydrolase